jgi:hypothetical protein
MSLLINSSPPIIKHSITKAREAHPRGGSVSTLFLNIRRRQAENRLRWECFSATLTKEMYNAHQQS